MVGHEEEKTTTVKKKIFMVIPGWTNSVIPTFAIDIRFLSLFYVFFAEEQNFDETKNVDWRRYAQIGGEYYEDSILQGDRPRALQGYLDEMCKSTTARNHQGSKTTEIARNCRRNHQELPKIAEIARALFQIG